MLGLGLSIPELVGRGADGVADGDADPDVVTDGPTTGTTTELDLDHTNKNRHVYIYNNLAFDAANQAAMVLEFQRASDDVWEQGATAYQYHELDQTVGTNPTTGANVPATDGAEAGVFGQWFISDGGLAVPTKFSGRSWVSASTGRLHNGFMTNENLHKAVRLRITTGGRTFASGTVYLIRME